MRDQRVQRLQARGIDFGVLEIVQHDAYAHAACMQQRNHIGQNRVFPAPRNNAINTVESLHILKQLERERLKPRGLPHEHKGTFTCWKAPS